MLFDNQLANLKADNSANFLTSTQTPSLTGKHFLSLAYKRTSLVIDKHINLLPENLANFVTDQHLDLVKLKETRVPLKHPTTLSR